MYVCMYVYIYIYTHVYIVILVIVIIGVPPRVCGRGAHVRRGANDNKES